MTKQELITAIGIIVLGVSIIVYSFLNLRFGTLIRPGPGMFPVISGVGMMVSSAIWMIPGLKKLAPAVKLWGKGELINPIILTIISAIYAVIFTLAGFVVSTFLFIVSWQIVIENNGTVKSLIVAAICTACLYIVFIVLLRVPLPAGLLKLL